MASPQPESKIPLFKSQSLRNQYTNSLVSAAFLFMVILVHNFGNTITMKTAFTTISILLSAVMPAQISGPLKVFKNKDAKVRSNNLHHLQILENGDIELVAFLKKKSAEKLILNSDLNMNKREEVEFDFDEDEKRIGGRFFDYTYSKTEVVKTDVLEVASADVFSKALGLNMIQKGKIGIKNGLAFKVQKGDIKLTQSESQETNYYGSAGSTTTGSNAVFTWFDVKDELKLKSDEGKNLAYEFHSSKGESIQANMNTILAKALAQMQRKGKDHQADNASADELKNFKALMEADADLLLIGKRNPVYKFGKAPSEEDMLPLYYVFKMSPKEMDVVAQSKFAETVSRAIVYREALKLNEGVILVSAPTTLFKPKDPNPRNYVFRLVGNDTRLKFEFNHEVPSGFTQFSQAFELPDSSIVLLAGFNGKKTDKYLNHYVTPFNTKSIYLLVIKNGKVTREESITEEAWNAGFTSPSGSEVKKDPYSPSIELKENIATEYLPNGGLITFWSVQSTDSKGLPVYMGDVALQFSADGKFEARYWMECKEQALKRTTASTVIRKNSDEFYWVTFEPLYQKEETRVVKSVATKVMAGYANPVITKINTASKTISSKTIAGDDKHVVGESFPYQLINGGIQFFGFDKGGKEFWTQTVTLN